MSIQVHAPPTEEEMATIPRGDGAIQAPTWAEEDGWCSACLERPRRVVHMGTESRNFALCAFCLARLIDTLKSAENRSEGRDGKT